MLPSEKAKMDKKNKHEKSKHRKDVAKVEAIKTIVREEARKDSIAKLITGNLAQKESVQIANKTSVKLELKQDKQFESRPTALRADEIKKANETAKANVTKAVMDVKKSNETKTVNQTAKPVAKAVNQTAAQKP